MKPMNTNEAIENILFVDTQEACLDGIASWVISPDEELEALESQCAPVLFDLIDNEIDISDYETLPNEVVDLPIMLRENTVVDVTEEYIAIQERYFSAGKLISARELSDLLQHKKPVPTPPDISAGLGRKQERQDIVNLEKYITGSLTLMVYKGALWEFEAPCWRYLDFCRAAICFRRLFDRTGLSNTLTTNEYRAIYQLLLSDPDIQHEDDIEPPLHCINLQDGTLNLLTMEFYPHDPHDGFFSFLNLSFQDIQEMSSGPYFEHFAAQIGNNDLQVRQQLLELIALAITGYEAKVFYVLLGPSNTGKTQFGRFLEELLGRENVASLAGVHDFSNRFTTSSLEGKMLATCLDLPDSPLPSVAVGVIKQVVGDDLIKVEAKYKDSRTIYRKPLLLFAGNHPIRISGIEREDAFLNRMVVIPFLNPVPPENMQPKLYTRLLDEAPYIVARAIEAYKELLERNFTVTRVDLPEAYVPQDSRNGYRAVERFISECCMLQPEYETETRLLYFAYQRFANERSLARLSEIEFSRRLSEYLKTCTNVTRCKRVKDKNLRGYQGIGLLDEWML